MQYDLWIFIIYIYLHVCLSLTVSGVIYSSPSVRQENLGEYAENHHEQSVAPLKVRVKQYKISGATFTNMV